MNDLCTYFIELLGPVDAAEINALVPVHLTSEPSDPCTARFSACTDQSGLVGLLRHLHALGLVLLSVSRIEIQSGAESAPDQIIFQRRP